MNRCLEFLRLDITHLCSRYWLFGEKIQHDGIKKRERGWFPRTCAVELTEGTYNEQEKNKWFNIGSESRYEYVEELIESEAGVVCGSYVLFMYLVVSFTYFQNAFHVVSEDWEYHAVIAGQSSLMCSASYFP